LVSHHSQSPNVYELIITTGEHLWSLVEERASIGPHLKALKLGPVNFSDFKINKLEISCLPIVKNILRFDVSVTNTMSM
jgi:hypothetical protein